MTYAARQVGGVTAGGRIDASTDLEVDAPQGQLFARLEMPNGISQVRAVPVERPGRSRVVFDVGYESPAETMAWSTARLRYDRVEHSLKAQAGMKEAWIQRWVLKEGEWVQVPLTQSTVQSRETALQLELPPLRGPGALVVETGGPMPQVLVLPSDRRLMALLTTTRSGADQRQTQVVIGGYGSRAEGLLDFLRKGAMDAAGQIADEARHYLFEKSRDPIGATAAAYYLLRTRDWERMPAQWLNNLADWNPDIPDAHLIRACARIQRGVETAQAASIAAEGIRRAFRAGYPLFWEARDVLEELYSWCARWLSLDQDALVRNLLKAAKPAGLTFGFAGRLPWAPGVRDVVSANPPYQPRLPRGLETKAISRARTTDALRFDLTTSLILPSNARARPFGDSVNTLFLQDHL